MDALGILMIGAGGFLVYAAVKGEHPWTLFTSVLTSSTQGPSIAGISNTGNAGATGSAAEGSVVQTSSGPVKVH